jgi:hypothetical protein
VYVSPPLFKAFDNFLTRDCETVSLQAIHKMKNLMQKSHPTGELLSCEGRVWCCLLSSFYVISGTETGRYSLLVFCYTLRLMLTGYNCRRNREEVAVSPARTPTMSLK